MEKRAISFDKNIIKKDMGKIMKHRKLFDDIIRSPIGESYNSNHINLDQIDKVYIYDPSYFRMVARLKNPLGKPIYMDFIFIHYDTEFWFKIFMTHDYKLFNKIIFAEQIKDDDHFPEMQFWSVFHGFLKLVDIPSHLRHYCKTYMDALSDYARKPDIFHQGRYSLRVIPKVK